MAAVQRNRGQGVEIGELQVLNRHMFVCQQALIEAKNISIFFLTCHIYCR